MMRDDLIPLLVHPSQLPDRVHSALLHSLSSSEIDHQFHYSTPKQAQQWLRIFHGYSPFQNDPSCQQIYEESFRSVSSTLAARRVHVVGLGCGSAEKDLRLLDCFKAGATQVSFTAVDVSPALALTAYSNVKNGGHAQTSALVCDLTTITDLASVLDSLSFQGSKDAIRLLTFFGLIPNFEPQTILPVLASLAGPRDFVLVSANTMNHQNPAASMRKIRSQYDNEDTNQWLLTFLLDLGVERSDGKLKWQIEPIRSNPGLARFVASFIFAKRREIAVGRDEFQFKPGEQIRLFYSYRYTPNALKRVFRRHHLSVEQLWLTPSGEEIVVLCRKSIGETRTSRTWTVSRTN